MRILSFDTSTSTLHVALLADRDVVAQKELPPTSVNRSDIASQLIPAVADLLAASDWHKKQLEGLVVGVGPGSFTGIRVGVITARTLAQTLDLPLAGISYLDAVAAAAALPGPVAVVLKAGAKPAYYAGGFEPRAQDPAFAATPQAFLPQEKLLEYLSGYAAWLANQEAEVALVADSGVVDGGAISIRPLPAIKNIAAQQAQLAYDRLSLKAAWDARWQDVFPLYLQSPSVTLKQDHGNRDQKSQTRRP